MAGINLVPNPSILLIQLGLFLTVLLAIKRLFVAPYLVLKDKRLRATVGNKAGAADILSANEKSKKKLEDQLQDVAKQARDIIETAKAEATKERDVIVKTAEQETSDKLSGISKRIADELASEKLKVAAVVDQLSQSLYSQTVGRS